MGQYLCIQYKGDGSRGDAGTFLSVLWEAEEREPRGRMKGSPRDVDSRLKPSFSPGLEKGLSGRMLTWAHFHGRRYFVSFP